jgi:DNA polymerase III subunit chi
MTDIMFYHLEHKPWDQVLPGLLTKSRERDWRCIVQISNVDRVEEVSELLWKSEVDLFLAHGSKADGKAAQQPIWLTAEHENPNAASVKFLLEGAPVENIAEFSRVVILFDGRDEDAITRARLDWKKFKADGHNISYYQQDENYRWINKSKSGEPNDG